MVLNFVLFQITITFLLRVQMYVCDFDNKLLFSKLSQWFPAWLYKNSSFLRANMNSWFISLADKVLFKNLNTHERTPQCVFNLMCFFTRSKSYITIDSILRVIHNKFKKSPIHLKYNLGNLATCNNLSVYQIQFKNVQEYNWLLNRALNQLTSR